MPATTVENSFICIFSKQFVFSLPQAINKKLISNKKKKKNKTIHMYISHTGILCVGLRGEGER